MRNRVELETESEASAVLVGRLGQLRPGALLTAGSLVLVPLYEQRAGPGLAYRTLAAALASGGVIVAEKPSASVPTLQVVNRGNLPILIIDGEEVVGGRQNRVVNTSLLVPARSTFDLPVSCVEHGRWHEAAPTFEAGEAAYPSLRRQKAAQVSAAFEETGEPVADQAAVWEEIAVRQRSSRTASRTGALRDTYAQRGAELGDLERRLPCPSDGPVGVAAVIGGHAACVDVFDRADTLRAYWPRLVRSYGLEAADAPKRKAAAGTVERLIERARAARKTAYRSPGLGLDLRLSGHGVVGASLVEGGVAVHTAIFRQRRGRGGESPIQAPSRRAGRR